MNKILEKGETIETIIGLVELEKAQEAGCDELLDQHPQAEKVSLGCSTKGNPTQYVQQKQESKEWRVQSWTDRAALRLCSTAALVCAHLSKRSQVR